MLVPMVQSINYTAESNTLRISTSSVSDICRVTAALLEEF